MLSSEVLFYIHTAFCGILEMLSSIDIHIGSLWYQALEMLSSEILFDIHIASLW